MNLKDDLLAELDEYISRLQDLLEEEREFSLAIVADGTKAWWVARHRIESEYGNTKRKVVERQAWEVAELEDEYERLPRA